MTDTHNNSSSKIIDSLGSKWHIEPEDLSGQILHCLMPHQCRQQVTISLSASIPEDQANSMLLKALSKMDDHQHKEIIEIVISIDENDTNKKIYQLTFICIPNELISKMLSNNINKCIFYIGYSENTRSYTFLDKHPYDKDLAKVNIAGKELPYMSKMVNLKNFDL
jgi:hypothetical protein